MARARARFARSTQNNPGDSGSKRKTPTDAKAPGRSSSALNGGYRGLHPTSDSDLSRECRFGKIELCLAGAALERAFSVVREQPVRHRAVVAKFALHDLGVVLLAQRRIGASPLEEGEECRNALAARDRCHLMQRAAGKDDGRRRAAHDRHGGRIRKNQIASRRNRLLRLMVTAKRRCCAPTIDVVAVAMEMAADGAVVARRRYSDPSGSPRTERNVRFAGTRRRTDLAADRLAHLRHQDAQIVAALEAMIDEGGRIGRRGRTEAGILAADLVIDLVRKSQSSKSNTRGTNQYWRGERHARRIVDRRQVLQHVCAPSRHGRAAWSQAMSATARSIGVEHDRARLSAAPYKRLMVPS